MFSLASSLAPYNPPTLSRSASTATQTSHCTVTRRSSSCSSSVPPAMIVTPPTPLVTPSAPVPLFVRVPTPPLPRPTSVRPVLAPLIAPGPCDAPEDRGCRVLPDSPVWSVGAAHAVVVEHSPVAQSAAVGLWEECVAQTTIIGKWEKTAVSGASDSEPEHECEIRGRAPVAPVQRGRSRRPSSPGARLIARIARSWRRADRLAAQSAQA
jgi:hypothetical protein